MSTFQLKVSSKFKYKLNKGLQKCLIMADIKILKIFYNSELIWRSTYFFENEEGWGLSKIFWGAIIFKIIGSTKMFSKLHKIFLGPTFSKFNKNLFEASRTISKMFAQY